jgi:hypothetical protein
VISETFLPAQGLLGSTTVLISTGGALLGVLVGGVINWAIQSSNDKRRQQAMAQAGARLVSAQLDDTDQALVATLEDRTWRRTRTLPTDAWTTYREALALCLAPTDFDAVAKAVAYVQRLSTVLETMLGASASNPLSEERLGEIEEARKSLNQARARLDVFSR